VLHNYLLAGCALVMVNLPVISARIPAFPVWQTRQDTIVRNVTGPVNPPPSTLQVEVTIGRADGPPEYIIGQIASVAMAKDGSIFIGESSPSATNVRQYDPQGRYLRTFGHRGMGPGELRSVQDIAIHPDGRVLILDDSKGSVLVYSPTGQFQVEWPVPGISVLQQFHFFTTPDGITYVPTRYTSPTPPATSQTLYKYIRLNSSGVVLDTLLPPPPPANLPPRRITGTGTNGQPRSLSIPFAPEHVPWMSRLGYFVTGRTDRAAIDLHLPTQQGQTSIPWRPGDPITSLRHNIAPTPFPASERQYIRDRIDNALRTGGSGWNWNGAEIPVNRPAFQMVLSGMDGRIFHIGFDQQHTYSGGELSDWDDEAVHMWSVYEPSGRFLGRLRTEPQQVVIPGWGDWVMLINFGADIPTVSRAKIIWAAGR
jgi:hypothetical protein